MRGRAEQAGQRASLSLDSAKRLKHAALHSAGHAIDAAMVAAVGPGVFLPLKGYHFEDSPYVEYRGVIPGGLEKDALVEKVWRNRRVMAFPPPPVFGGRSIDRPTSSVRTTSH